MIHHSPPVLVIDAAALVTIFGSLAGQLPNIAAGLAALWYLIAITDHVIKWFKKD